MARLILFVKPAMPHLDNSKTKVDKLHASTPLTAQLARLYQYKPPTKPIEHVCFVMAFLSSKT